MSLLLLYKLGGGGPYRIPVPGFEAVPPLAAGPPNMQALAALAGSFDSAPRPLLPSTIGPLPSEAVSIVLDFGAIAAIETGWRRIDSPTAPPVPPLWYGWFDSAFAKPFPVWDQQFGLAEPKNVPPSTGIVPGEITHIVLDFGAVAQAAQWVWLPPLTSTATAVIEGWRAQLDLSLAAKTAIDVNQPVVSPPSRSFEGWREALSYRFTASPKPEGYTVQPNSPPVVIAFPNGWQIDQEVKFANIAPGPQPFQAHVWTITVAPATGQWSWQQTMEVRFSPVTIPGEFSGTPIVVPPAPTPPAPTQSPPGHGDLPKRLRLNRGIRPIWDVVRERERLKKTAPVIEIAPEPAPAKPQLKTEVSRKALTLPHENVPLPPFTYAITKKPQGPKKHRTQLTHREAQELLLIALAALDDEDED